MVKPNCFPSANYVFHLKQKAEYLDLKFHVWNFSQLQILHLAVLTSFLQTKLEL